MITLQEAYKKVKPLISNKYEIDSCEEYEDYFSFPERERNGKPIIYIGVGPLGVQKSTGKLCHIGFNIEKFCDASWDFETEKPISDDIGEPLKKYNRDELKFD